MKKAYISDRSEYYNGRGTTIFRWACTVYEFEPLVNNETLVFFLYFASVQTPFWLAWPYCDAD